MRRQVLDVAGTTLEYIDTGGDGPPVVMLHGALMDEQLWLPVVQRLSPRLRCVVPVLPMGAHRIPREEGADQSPPAIAQLVGAFIRALELPAVTLVGNDTGGALAQLLVAADPAIAERLVLVSTDAFDNFPPGLPGRTMSMACAVPGGLPLAMSSLRLRPLRRLPMTFGWMTKRPIPSEVFDSWLDAFAGDRRVRRDVRAMMRSLDRTRLVAAAERLDRFRGDALVVWAAEDKVMPIDHAHALCRALGGSRLELVEDSYTLVPLDQPGRLAHLIDDFVPDRSRAPESGSTPQAPIA